MPMLECKGNTWQMLKERGGLIHAFSTKKVGFLWHWSLPWSCMCGVLFSVFQLASVDIFSLFYLFFFSDTIVDRRLPKSCFLAPVCSFCSA